MRGSPTLASRGPSRSAETKQNLDEYNQDLSLNQSFFFLWVTITVVRGVCPLSWQISIVLYHIFSGFWDLNKLICIWGRSQASPGMSSEHELKFLHGHLFISNRLVIFKFKKAHKWIICNSSIVLAAVGLFPCGSIRDQHYYTPRSVLVDDILEVAVFSDSKCITLSYIHVSHNWWHNWSSSYQEFTEITTWSLKKDQWLFKQYLLKLVCVTCWMSVFESS